ncbi:hypothetical protein FA13DRAFT_1704897 [Coprinellus micaceus]|uniref:Uncharacterized protein n=1 Tax=Coprinellus micaceus TaxID=71717 RepID=A0A4Y7TUX4_COPMI|nr:hypothetical protein FA13DRAFT_1704897 [Coprinellus micaceus]
MHTCEGCNRTFEKLDSFSRHQRRCASLKLKQALALETFQAELLNRDNLPATPGTSSAEQAQHPTPTYLGINQHAGVTPSKDRLEDTSFSGGEPMVTIDEGIKLPRSDSTRTALVKSGKDRNILWPGLYQDEVPSMASVMGDNPAGQDILYGDDHLSDSPGFQQTMDRADSGWWRQLGSDSSLQVVAAQKEPPVNNSTFLLLQWYWDPTTATKTFADADKLVKDVILHPDFTKEDFENYLGTARETEKLNQFLNSPESLLPTSDRWMQSSLSLPLPCPGYDFTTTNPPVFKVDGLYHRKMLDVIKASLSEPSAQYLHFTGFEEYFKPPLGGRDQRIYSEIYNSNAFLRAEERVKKQAAASGSQLKASVLALQLGDKIQDAYIKEFHHAPQSALLTHLHKELFQLIWYELIDEEFVKAYNDGFKWKCADGITRLLFPRILTYSADYPEKALIACIKSLGNHPCPLCLVTKEEICNLGTPADFANHEDKYCFDNHPLWYDIESAQKRLFKGESITSTWFKDKLEVQSITPSRSTFSKRLEHDDYFQVFSILTLDLLHEIEIGTWKATFTHLIRMLQSVGQTSVARLNSRYRHIPSFGRDTIRHFSNDTAEMKRLGARDFEDLLQCSIPVFRNLFHKQRHSDRIRVLLFEFATWHALAKLRRHTETTIKDLCTSTAQLGELLRDFADNLSPKYLTKELLSERERRIRTQARKGLDIQNETTKESRTRKFNLSTFKLHAMGHYPEAILEYGTTDNYSTQIGESQHRHVKRWYTRVRKGNATFVTGITRQQRHEGALFQLKAHAEKGRGCTIDTTKQLFLPFEYSEKLEKAPAYLHHQISNARRKENRIVLPDWIEENSGDPAFKDFLPRLKTHLLLRLHRQSFQGDEHAFTATELNSVIIEDQTIYSHKGARFNYTTYNGRREQDSIGTWKNANVMMLAHEDNPSGHGLWYARVVGVLHCRVIHNTPSAALGVRSKDMEFLWVHWLGLQSDHEYGWKAKDLPKVGFIDKRVDNTMAFGFLDLLEVIRAVHLIPSFTEGKGNNGMPRTIARPSVENNLDWNYFYVNIDMFMRYRGGGVGHTSTAAATRHFLDDRDVLDTTEEDEADVNMNDRSDSDSEVEEGDEIEAMEEGSTSELGDEHLDEELDFDYDWDDIVQLSGEEDEEDPEDISPEDGEEEQDKNGHEIVGFARF